VDTECLEPSGNVCRTLIAGSLLLTSSRDPNDKSTWIRERTNMPQHGRISVREVAPTAWAAICELCGGEDRIADGGDLWSDGFIVNLGAPEYEGKRWGPKELDNWHVDGDFFSA
jgi:hypothetical protein